MICYNERKGQGYPGLYIIHTFDQRIHRPPIFPTAVHASNLLFKIYFEIAFKLETINGTDLQYIHLSVSDTLFSLVILVNRLTSLTVYYKYLGERIMYLSFAFEIVGLKF